MCATETVTESDCGSSCDVCETHRVVDHENGRGWFRAHEIRLAHGKAGILDGPLLEVGPSVHAEAGFDFSAQNGLVPSGDCVREEGRVRAAAQNHSSTVEVVVPAG